jgi:hypothetical protein
VIEEQLMRTENVGAGFGNILGTFLIGPQLKRLQDETDFRVERRPENPSEWRCGIGQRALQDPTRRMYRIAAEFETFAACATVLETARFVPPDRAAELCKAMRHLISSARDPGASYGLRAAAHTMTLDLIRPLFRAVISDCDEDHTRLLLGPFFSVVGSCDDDGQVHALREVAFELSKTCPGGLSDPRWNALKDALKCSIRASDVNRNILQPATDDMRGQAQDFLIEIGNWLFAH